MGLIEPWPDKGKANHDIILPLYSFAKQNTIVWYHSGSGVLHIMFNFSVLKIKHSNMKFR